MVRIMQIKKEIVQNIYTIVDFSYAWEVINNYLVDLQNTISETPQAVLMLKTVFLKMATIMERPLQRIIECASEDQYSVAKYYSGQLYRFVQQVLYIIPVNIFK
jgi:WASH complex subunit strumpellin